MKAIVQLITHQFVKSVAQVVLIMWKANAPTQLNVLTVARTTCLGLMNARCGKGKRNSKN